MRLRSQLARLERALPAYLERRAAEKERRAEYESRFPTPFDRKLERIRLAWQSPSLFSWEADQDAVRRTVRTARDLGTVYYEEGGDALRRSLRDLRAPGRRAKRPLLDEQQIERLAAWCAATWGAGSRHPLDPAHPQNWLDFQFGALSDETRVEYAARARRFPRPVDAPREELADRHATASIAEGTAHATPAAAFDGWLAGVRAAWAARTAPTTVDEAALIAAYALGALYRERGDEALRDWLRDGANLQAVGHAGATPSAAQVERALVWCRDAWGLDGRHLYAPDQLAAVTEAQPGRAALLAPLLEAHALRFPAPADVLAQLSTLEPAAAAVPRPPDLPTVDVYTPRPWPAIG